ncbi:MAG: twin-arginine translocase subunit TatC [Candidatus Marinimicrobia bacterium]|nr:twin-arginine translocase subunit TatC [Candidatus Neomarinimicrobiota bacterium]
MNLNSNEMPFLDHLEELRWRIIKVLLGVICGSILSFIFVDKIIALLLIPVRSVPNAMNLQVLQIQGMFMIKWGISFICGGIISLPLITYQIWEFVSPGLHLKEKKIAFPLIFFTFISFIAGITFAYFILIPISLNFFTSMGYSGIQNNFSINYYLSFITWLMIGCGCLFELPVLIFILARLNIATPSFLRHYRKHAMIVIMILSAIITPPDPVSLIIMTIPLVLIYEISIGVAFFAQPK